MAFIAREDDDEERSRGDMTPMIDIIFLLLVFFILTTTFVAPEKGISSLMPTDKGEKNDTTTEVEPNEDVNIRIWPATLDRDAGIAELDAAWKNTGTSRDDRVYVQIGGGTPLLVDGDEMSRFATEDLQSAAVGQVHAYIIERLREREQDAPRNKQDPIVIHCFSGLSWKYAAAAYDAVRNYEELQSGIHVDNKNAVEQLAVARPMAFAPPRLRRYHEWELGNELHEIIHMK